MTLLAQAVELRTAHQKRAKKTAFVVEIRREAGEGGAKGRNASELCAGSAARQAVVAKVRERAAAQRRECA